MRKPHFLCLLPLYCDPTDIFPTLPTARAAHRASLICFSAISAALCSACKLLVSGCYCAGLSSNSLRQQQVATRVRCCGPAFCFVELTWPAHTRLPQSPGKAFSCTVAWRLGHVYAESAPLAPHLVTPTGISLCLVDGLALLKIALRNLHDLTTSQASSLSTVCSDISRRFLRSAGCSCDSCVGLRCMASLRAQSILQRLWPQPF